MSEKEISCCFTGHRTLPTDKMEEVVIHLDREVERLIAKGVTRFISGGALGFDQMAASLIATKKELGRDIRLIFVLPCKNQDELWSEKQKTLFHALLCKADEIIYVSEQYVPFCMKKRNCYMVENSAHCICALIREKSGTGQTVRYARKKGLQVVNVVA